MHSDVLKYDGRLPEPPYKTEGAECEECASLNDEIEQLQNLAQDAYAAYAAWDNDRDMQVGKLLRVMLDSDFRKTYRPDIVTPNAGETS